MPATTNGLDGVVTAMTPSSTSLTADMMRSPPAVGLMNPASEGAKLKRHTTAPPGRRAFFRLRFWVLPAFRPDVTWKVRVFSCSGKYDNASRIRSLGRAAPTTPAPRWAAICC